MNPDTVLAITITINIVERRASVHQGPVVGKELLLKNNVFITGTMRFSAINLLFTWLKVISCRDAISKTPKHVKTSRIQSWIARVCRVVHGFKVVGIWCFQRLGFQKILGFGVVQLFFFTGCSWSRTRPTKTLHESLSSVRQKNLYSKRVDFLLMCPKTGFSHTVPSKNVFFQ